MSAWEEPGKTDDWYTPKYNFDALGCCFDLDVAHPRKKTNVPCRARLEQNSLETPWRGFVWMNAPYGGRNGLIPWLKKFFAHGNGIALVPDRTSAPWFQTAAQKAEVLLFLSPKVRFIRPDGTVGTSPGTGSVLMSVGSSGRKALLRAKRLGFLARRAA